MNCEVSKSFELQKGQELLKLKIFFDNGISFLHLKQVVDFIIITTFLYDHILKYVNVFHIYLLLYSIN